jgi:hypothetical protein
VFNLRSRLGCDSYFGGNKKQVLDTFAVLIRRNVFSRKTTLLVSRLKSKQVCAAYLTARLADWGITVKFVLSREDLPTVPEPSVIPIIHYGVVGVNDFSAYECAYCLNGYYVASNTLNRALAEFEPEAFGTDVRIVSGDALVRRAELVDHAMPDADRSLLANAYLQRLEVDPVVQAVGRVQCSQVPRRSSRVMVVRNWCTAHARSPSRRRAGTSAQCSASVHSAPCQHARCVHDAGHQVSVRGAGQGSALRGAPRPRATSSRVRRAPETDRAGVQPARFDQWCHDSSAISCRPESVWTSLAWAKRRT